MGFYIRQLLDFRANVRKLADIGGKTARHPDTDIDKAVNDSVVMATRIAARTGRSTYFVTSPAFAPTFPENLVPGSGFQSASPSGLTFDSVQGIIVRDVSDANDTWMLDRLAPDELAGYLNEPPGRPRVFLLNGVSGTANGFVVMPVPDAAYPFTFIGPFSVEKLIGDTDEVTTSIVELFEWIEHNAAERFCVADADRKRLDMIIGRKREIQARLIHNADQTDRAGPLRRRDTRGERMRNERRTRPNRYP